MIAEESQSHYTGIKSLSGLNQGSNVCEKPGKVESAFAKKVQDEFGEIQESSKKRSKAQFEQFYAGK